MTAIGKALLDWWWGGATPTRPTAWYVNLSLGSPTNVTASEMSTGSGISRMPVVMPAASSAVAINSSGTVENTAAITMGTLSGGANSFSGVASPTNSCTDGDTGQYQASFRAWGEEE